ncbi:sensor histidine kinase [Calidifontibacter sp. DB0510]|uniref:histidine kinase n=1 Tax=Metallococcus carri TaxID=1656884 RepID=A0A967B324_9MICO|nr:sensor histidine kinase [Metallococcus carri]NHN57069.1 sensor histidine kinase [Metallococcus carri]NOP39062.1 sensor histidine kinase [Calidifontibacter sp. DB2511S]
MASPGPQRSLARQFLAVQVVIVVLMVAAGLTLAVLNARSNARSRATERALAVAVSVADSPLTASALSSSDPSAILQPYAERVRRDTHVDFVVVMDLQHKRFTHPDPAQIGGRFLGDVGSAPQGRAFAQEYTGTLGPSMRAVVPVFAGGKVVAMVAVGITIEAIDRQIWPSVLGILAAGAIVLALGVTATILAARRLRRQTHGLSRGELSQMYEFHQAVLHAVREGLLLVDPQHRVQLANDEARKLLALPEDVVGRPVAELGLPPALVQAVIGGQTGEDDVYVLGGAALVVSSSPAHWQGEEVGSVVTLRDRTELQTVSGELDVVRSLTDALRARNHESANRLHTVVSLIEMGRPQDAVDLATEDLQAAQLLADEMVDAVQDPVLGALLLGKSAEAAERGLMLDLDADVTSDRCAIDSRDLITVAGNLIDNAFDAARTQVAAQIDWDATDLTITVEDDGPGIPAQDVQRVLQRGWSTKAGPPGSRGIGLALVAQVATRHDGEVAIERSALGGVRLVVTLRGGR